MNKCDMKRCDVCVYGGGGGVGKKGELISLFFVFRLERKAG